MKQSILTLAAVLAVSQMSSASIFDNYTLDPTPGTVQSLHSFTLKYPDTTGYTDLTWGSKATLVLPDGTEVQSGNWQQELQGITFEFGETYTAAGSYTLKIPAGWLKQNGEENPAFSVVYTVGETEEPTVTLPDDFEDGIIMLNEDWFGHTSSSMNFLGNDGTLYYNVYKSVNPEHCLGNTSQYGQVFGDRLFIMSKQNYTGDGRTGGRFIAMDSKTLEFKGELTSLPGGDGRSICAVSAHKGYIGTASGLYTLSLDTYQAGTVQLAPANTAGRVQQTGEMLRYGKYLFVAQQSLGVLAVDTDTDAVTVIDLPTVATVFVTADGSLYAATTDANAEFVKIDPLTLQTETIDVEGSHALDSPWGTWRKASLAAATDSNTVFYVSGGGWSPKKVSSYNFDTKEFTADFFTLPGKSAGLAADRILYGEGVSCDPASGNLLVTATESGYGEHYSNNWVYFIDTTDGSVVKEITLDKYYWFPAMMIYPDYDAPELDVPAIELAQGESANIDVAEATTLRVGNKHLVCYATRVSNGEGVCNATLSGGNLTVEALAPGNATITLTADYQGRTSTVEIPVTVSVVSGIDSISNDADAPHDVYSLTGVLLIRNATAEQIRNLDRGIYLIGGKKVAIK